MLGMVRLLAAAGVVFSLALVGSGRPPATAGGTGQEPDRLVRAEAASVDDGPYAGLLASPGVRGEWDDVDRDWHELAEQRRLLVTRLLDVLAPENRAAYGPAQRDAAAVLLGVMRERRVRAVFPALSAMFEEEAQREVRPRRLALEPAVWPAYDALGRIGRSSLPTVEQLVRTSEEPRVRQRAAQLFGEIIGRRSWALEALATLADQAEDGIEANRLREAHAWLEARGDEKSEDTYPVLHWPTVRVRDPAETTGMNLTERSTYASLLEDPEEVEAHLHGILEQHRLLVQRLLEVLAPENREAYGEKQRKAAAVILRRIRAPQAVPALAAMFEEETLSIALEDYMGKKGLDPYRVPVYNALGSIGRHSLPAVEQLVKTSEHERVRRRAARLFALLIGKKSWTLEALKTLAEEEQDRVQAKRLREAHAFIETSRERRVKAY